MYFCLIFACYHEISVKYIIRFFFVFMIGECMSLIEKFKYENTWAWSDGANLFGIIFFPGNAPFEVEILLYN